VGLARHMDKCRKRGEGACGAQRTGLKMPGARGAWSPASGTCRAGRQRRELCAAGHKGADMWTRVVWWLWAAVALAAGLARGEGKRAEPKKNSNIFYLFENFQNDLN
jgi:hypothetical protein